MVGLSFAAILGFFICVDSEANIASKFGITALTTICFVILATAVFFKEVDLQERLRFFSLETRSRKVQDQTEHLQQEIQTYTLVSVNEWDRVRDDEPSLALIKTNLRMVSLLSWTVSVSIVTLSLLPLLKDDEGEFVLLSGIHENML